MQSLYRIKTAKFFEKVKTNSGNESRLEEEPYAVLNIGICTESRMLAIASVSSYVMLFKFQKKEKITETKFMEIPIVYEVSNLSHGLHKKSEEQKTSPENSTGTSPKQHFEFPPRPLLQVRQI